MTHERNHTEELKAIERLVRIVRLYKEGMITEDEASQMFGKMLRRMYGCTENTRKVTGK